MRETFDAIMASYDHMTNTKPLAYRLAYIADLEATFTPSFRFLLDNADIMFRPGDDRVASLLLWHRVEEVEHRSSALIIYNAVVGRRLYRLRILPGVIRHITGALVPIYISGVNAHVPEKDRVLDLRGMSVSWRVRDQLRSLARRDGLGRNVIPPMLKNVDRRDQRQALRGLILSQNP